MKSYKLYINLMLLVIMCIATASCDVLFNEDDDLYNGEAVTEFFPLSDTFTLTPSEAGTTPVKVQLIGKQRSSALNVSFVVVDSLTNAQGGGVHYTLPATSVTIAANTSTASFDLGVTGANLAPDEVVVLVLQLQAADGVQPSENLKQYTLTLIGEEPPTP